VGTYPANFTPIDTTQLKTEPKEIVSDYIILPYSFQKENLTYNRIRGGNFPLTQYPEIINFPRQTDQKPIGKNNSKRSKEIQKEMIEKMCGEINEWSCITQIFSNMKVNSRVGHDQVGHGRDSTSSLGLKSTDRRL
jgi:hypothetical protein